MESRLHSAPAETETLVDRLDRLNDELQAIREIIDSIRVDFQGGLQNGRVSLVLSEPESLDECREAAVGADTVTLAIRLNAELGLLGDKIEAMIEEQRTTPVVEPETALQVTEPETPADATRETLPPITLFEIGDAVEFELDGEVWFGEIAELDDAENAALVQLVPSFEEVDIPQDLLTRVEPDELSRRAELWEQIMDADHEASPGLVCPSVGDRVRLNLHGHELEGEVNTVQRGLRTVEVVLTPSMETLTVEWSDLLPAGSQTGPSSSALQDTIEPLSARMAEHERWCHEVRDPARLHSEGQRVIRPANAKAVVEYEIAPLPNGDWAVTWRHSFRCGNSRGAGHPWTTRPTRDDCIKLVLNTSRKMFSANSLDKVQVPVAREMLHLLGEGLFGFHEPEPIVEFDPNDSAADLDPSDLGPTGLDPSGLAAFAEAEVIRILEESA